MIDVGELYRAEAPALRRFALFLSGNAATADDLVAETFIRLWTARERVDLATVRGYLFTIARNLFLQQVRGRKTHPAFVPIDEVAIDGDPGPEARAARRDELRVTLAALQELPEIDRAALLMRADDGLTYEEIGAALGVATGAVRVRVHRARLRLAAARSAAAQASTTSKLNQETER